MTEAESYARLRQSVAMNAQIKKYKVKRNLFDSIESDVSMLE